MRRRAGQLELGRGAKTLHVEAAVNAASNAVAEAGAASVKAIATANGERVQGGVDGLESKAELSCLGCKTGR